MIFLYLLLPTFVFFAMIVFSEHGRKCDFLEKTSKKRKKETTKVVIDDFSVSKKSEMSIDDKPRDRCASSFQKSRVGFHL